MCFDKIHRLRFNHYSQHLNLITFTHCILAKSGQSNISSRIYQLEMIDEMIHERHFALHLYYH